MSHHQPGPFEEIAETLNGRAAGDYADDFESAAELADEQAPYDADSSPVERPVEDGDRRVEYDDEDDGL